ncbi:MAG: glucose-6-phosphate isomerase, partial [Clostridiales bacterium]|nr:glucose-6-phosphate isomerase [Clostridiales bacterium]
MSVTLETRYLEGFVRSHELGALQAQVTAAHDMLHAGSGLGSDFLGWLTLPTDYDKAEFARIQAAAERIRRDTDVLIVIGIGGSYLGARAAIEFLKSPLYNAKKKETPDIYFAGNSISASALSELLELCEGRRVSVNVISKSGTTTEPAIAFRVFREYLERTVGREETRKRIYATTDRARGTLKAFADQEGYETFVVPDNVGGRYSVLTAVGLLPIAAAGCDITALMEGAAEAQHALSNPSLDQNDCYRYAAARNILLRKGRAVELMVSYEPCC